MSNWKRNLFPSQVSNIKFDKITGKIIETTKNGKIYTGRTGFIESQRDYIMDCIDRKVAPNVENARFDIAFYNFMLNSDEPEKRIDQYFDKKEELKTVCKREVAKALGWEILVP